MKLQQPQKFAITQKLQEIMNKNTLVSPSNFIRTVSFSYDCLISSAIIPAPNLESMCIHQDQYKVDFPSYQRPDNYEGS